MTVKAIWRPFPGIFRPKKSRIELYYGSGSVWRELPDFSRADSGLERLLCQYWNKWRYENKLHQEGERRN